MNRIKELRKKKGFTVADLAKEIEISQSMLSNYENGNSTPRNTETWEKMANLLDVTVPYLMGFDTKLTMGERTSEARKDMGLTTKQLARKVGITEETLKNFEADVPQSIDTHQLNKIASILQVSVSYLYGYTEYKTAEEMQKKLNERFVKSDLNFDELIDFQHLETSLQKKEQEAFSNRFKSARQKNGVDIKKLSKLTGLPSDFIEKIENGEGLPAPKDLENLIDKIRFITGNSIQAKEIEEHGKASPLNWEELYNNISSPILSAYSKELWERFVDTNQDEQKIINTYRELTEENKDFLLKISDTCLNSQLWERKENGGSLNA